jgi:hypothetical protein
MLSIRSEGGREGTQSGPVTGGSGEFRGASGEATVEFFSDEANITSDLD